VLCKIGNSNTSTAREHFRRSAGNSVDGIWRGTLRAQVGVRNTSAVGERGDITQSAQKLAESRAEYGFPIEVAVGLAGPQA